jgi:hypothetical protein
VGRSSDRVGAKSAYLRMRLLDTSTLSFANSTEGRSPHMLYFHTRLKKPRDRGSAARNVKVGFSSGSSPITVVALRQAYSMVKATLSPPRAFQSVKNRESGAFGGKFGKAPMQEEDHRVRSQLSPMAWPLCCQGKFWDLSHVL